MSFDEVIPQLFFGVVPAFISALPQLKNHGKIQQQNLDQDEEATRQQVLLLNVQTRLRQTIRQTPKYFNPASLTQTHTLSEDECGDAADALDLLLSKWETLVDDRVLSTGADRKMGKFERLSALKDLAAKSTWQDPEEILAVPDDLTSLISYLQTDDPATEVVQYRRLVKQGDNFNETMNQIFALKHSKSSDEHLKASQAISVAQKLGKISETISTLMLGNDSEFCSPPHNTMVHLSGFDEPEIETLMTLCKSKKSTKKIRVEEDKLQKWHVITWCQGEESTVADGKALCDKFRSTHKKKYRSKVIIRQDASWSSPLSSRLDSHRTAPHLTLESLLTPQDGQTMRKKERLQLAGKIASSLFYLIWSPLIQSPWSTSTIHIMKTSTESPTVQPYVQGYLLGVQDEHQAKASLASRKRLILDLGLLLWELFFSQKIVASAEDGGTDSEDEETDFSDTVSSDGSDSSAEDDVDPRFNAICRELDAAGEACVHPLCLTIISQSVDIYAGFDDYSSEVELHQAMYHSVMRPLLKYLETYNISTHPHSKRSKPTAIMKPGPAVQPHFDAKKLFLPHHKLQQQSIKEFPTIIRPMQKQSQPSSKLSILSGVLLSSTRTTASSADWLKRFDGINQQLKNSLKVSYPVRIAILDTGCDLENDFFAGPGVDFIDDIEASWIDYVDDSSSPVDEDPSQACSFARRSGRTRRFHDAGRQKQHSKDVICMSYGFGTEAPTVQAAITKAEQDRHGRILFFAAANNDGLNEPELFPAWLENVISVRGTHHDGSFVDKYNPNSWRHKRGLSQFGTLAANVPCGWLSDDLTKFGCSVATPILAAIAALVISYVGTFTTDFDANSQNLIRTRRGIETVFYEMAEDQPNKERLYLTPWFLFDRSNPVHLVGHALGKVPQHDVS